VSTRATCRRERPPLRRHPQPGPDPSMPIFWEGKLIAWSLLRVTNETRRQGGRGQLLWREPLTKA
jgi:hypothetical protein